MKILLSPAKSINENQQIKDIHSFPVFKKEAKDIVKKIKHLTSNDLQELMHISKDLADLNVKRFKDWKSAEVDTDRRLQVAFAFSGEVYRGLDFTTFNENELFLANEKIRILSGLYGILKPFDLIYPYRLEMGTSFSPKEEQKNLYEFWGAKVTIALQKELSKNEVLVNLASNEYAKVIQFEKLKNRVITPVFKEFKNGRFSIVMMYAKHARGAMARYLIQNELDSIEELQLYAIDGYSFDMNQSNENEWVFVR